MAIPAPSHRIARFGVFELDLRTAELRKKGRLVHLEEQPFQVLAELLGHSGELVTRDELRARLWPDAVFVDFDQGLNKCVAKIRAVLGDLAESPRFVETLKRRGYRFIAAVELVDADLYEAGRRTGIPSRRTPIVRLVQGEHGVPFGDGEHIIGRDPAAAIWIDSPVVSWRHARIVVGRETVTLEDLGSRNGTSVNGELITRPRALAHGDQIAVGPATLTVYMPPSQSVTAPE